TIILFHPADLRWTGARVRWSFKSGSHGRWTAAPATQTQKLSKYALVLWTNVPLPAGPFNFRACFHAPGSAALLNVNRPPRCSGRGYRGYGRLPVGFPAPAAVARAVAYLRGRIGKTALAVFDTEGRLSG